MLYSNAVWLCLLVAGKLADGYRGISWYEPMEEPPSNNCQNLPENNIYVCNRALGEGVNVSEAYFLVEKKPYMIHIEAEGEDCSDLREILAFAYGKGSPVSPYPTSRLDLWTWKDGPVFAGWAFNSHDAAFDLLILEPPEIDLLERQRELYVKNQTSGGGAVERVYYALLAEEQAKGLTGRAAEKSARDRLLAGDMPGPKKNPFDDPTLPEMGESGVQQESKKTDWPAPPTEPFPNTPSTSKCSVVLVNETNKALYEKQELESSKRGASEL